MKKLPSFARAMVIPLCAMLVVLFAFAWFRAQIADGLRTRAYATLHESASQQALFIRARLEGYYDALASAADYIAPRIEDEDAREELLVLLGNVATACSFSRTALVYPNGDAIADNGQSMSVTDRLCYQRGMEGLRMIEYVSASHLNGQPRILISVPIQSGSEVKGLIFASLDKETFSEMIDSPAFDANAISLLCNSSGEMISAGSRDIDAIIALSSSMTMTDSARATYERALETGSSAAFSSTTAGRTIYTACIPLGVGDWFLFVSVSRAVVDLLNDFVGQSATWMMALVLLVSVLTVVYTYLHERHTILRLANDKEMLRQSGERNALINRLSNEILFDIDLVDGHIEYNDRFEAVFRRPPIASTIHQLSTVSCVPEEDRPILTRLCSSMRAGQDAGAEELRILDADNQPRWQRIEYMTLKDETGAPIRVLGKMTDVTRQKHAMQQLRLFAESDSLTKLNNRASMEQRIRDYLLNEGTKGTHAFLMLDVDHFKGLNDSLGHMEGDRILIRVADEMRALFRTSDILARMGGDEFAVFMKSVGSDQRAMDKAEHLAANIRAISSEFSASVSASIGISIFNRDGTSFDALYKAADTALYRVKNSGGDRASMYSPEEDQKD